MWQVAKRRPGDGGGWWRNHRPRPLAVGRLTKAWAVLAVLGLLAALAPACGGGEPEAEGSPTPPPTAEDVCGALEALKAYRYSVTLEVESPEPEGSPAEPQPAPTSTLTREFQGYWGFQYNIEASFVAPDRFEVFISGIGVPFSMIFIGDQVWTELGGRWRPTPRLQQLPYGPPVVCEAVLADLDLLQAEPQEEKVNDVKSVHYTFSQVSSEQAWAKIYGKDSDLDILLKELDVDLWLAEKDQWPVRIDIRSSGLYGDGRELRAHLLLDIRDANSGDIRVEPPL